MDSRFKTATKTVSWRIIALIMTTGVSWAVTGQWEFGLAIGFIDTFLKMFAFYWHERFWLRFTFDRRIITSRLPFLRRRRQASAKEPPSESAKWAGD